MTTAILKTVKTFLRWNRNSVDGKLAAPNRIISRHGESSRKAKPRHILSPRADGGVNLNASSGAPPLVYHVDDRKNEPLDSVAHQPALAFGVRLIF